MGASTHKKNARDFNPRLILAQIFALQCYHYLTLALLYIASHVLTATPLSLERLFGYSRLSTGTVSGWLESAHHVGAYVGTAVGLVLIIEKSKKCLDFSVTLFLFHFIACCVHSGFPKSWEWWIFNVSGVISCTCLGEWLCSVREMREIPSLLG
mmetsp:Transcript_10366/g.20625  ORF Transcript_10366/g.20625 Transcript_10366/m.20625 type:complete len:154 (+) Transcript_10366:227-688(+)